MFFSVSQVQNDNILGFGKRTNQNGVIFGLFFYKKKKIRFQYLNAVIFWIQPCKKFKYPVLHNHVPVFCCICWTISTKIPKIIQLYPLLLKEWDVNFLQGWIQKMIGWKFLFWAMILCHNLNQINVKIYGW